MKRRDVLRYLASISAGAVAATMFDPFRPRLGFAQETLGKTLLVLFQRGGCDGLNTIVPYGDPEYRNLRPDIAIAAPDAGDPNSAIDLDGYFGLHPELQPLESIFSGGDLALFPAVHYPNSTQSHFDGQRRIESGANSDSIDGWLNRHLVTSPRPSALRAAGFETPIPHSLRGQEIVSNFTNVANYTFGLSAEDEQELLTELGRVYSQQPNSDKAYRELVTSFGRVLINDFSVLKGIDTDAYSPEHGARYPDSALGVQLRQIAQLVKEDVGLEVVTLSTGGWDTHSNQGGGEAGGRLSQNLRDVADAVAALHTDLGARWQNVMVLTMTEFGRTARQNASLGTDHGKASAWMAAGGGVRGGIYGAWPGLGSGDLVAGRYLDHTLDFRDILAEVLTAHLGNGDTSMVIPGYSPQSVGFIA